MRSESEIKETVAELRKHDKAASPGPWVTGQRHYRSTLYCNNYAGHRVADCQQQMGPEESQRNADAVMFARNSLSTLATDIEDLLAENARLREVKDGAYRERNMLVAALARVGLSLGWNVGLAKTAIEGWSEDWHNCIYIDSPNGQLSWHIHDSQMTAFSGFPKYSGAWDGHTTEQKYARLPAIQQLPQEHT